MMVDMRGVTSFWRIAVALVSWSSSLIERNR